MKYNKNIIILDANDDFKEVFGSFKLLDDIDVFDHTAVYQFARIIRNYINMANKLNELENN